LVNVGLDLWLKDNCTAYLHHTSKQYSQQVAAQDMFVRASGRLDQPKMIKWFAAG
jgi:hypothetical protein